MFFSLPTWVVALLLVALVGGATVAGFALGRSLREHQADLREPFGVLQGALLGVVGLILAFGLTLAVGRYQDRRTATVEEANAIGTSYLRAQLLAEPARSRSLVLFPTTPTWRSGSRRIYAKIRLTVDLGGEPTGAWTYVGLRDAIERC